MKMEKEGRTPQILVVEDDPAVAFGIVELLKMERHEVIHCLSGEEALISADQRPPDLVLLDISLPGINGYEVCRQLRKADYICPIIMLSARTQPVDRVVGLEVGADDYINKPFDSRELIARISAHLRSAERLRDMQRPRELRRHLLAVMFTDIVGYSRIMHIDELRAMRLLEIHNSIMSETIEREGGVVVEIIGDAFLARFESAVDAVRAASMALRNLERYNQNVAQGDDIHIRIGIHLGDVLDYGDHIKGDTVNIAARLQQIAAPDSICISENVHDVVNHKIEASFTNLGVQTLKNISHPIRVWRVSSAK